MRFFTDRSIRAVSKGVELRRYLAECFMDGDPSVITKVISFFFLFSRTPLARSCIFFLRGIVLCLPELLDASHASDIVAACVRLLETEPEPAVAFLEAISRRDRGARLVASNFSAVALGVLISRDRMDVATLSLIRGVIWVSSRLQLGDAVAILHAFGDLAIHSESAALRQEAGLCVRMALSLCPDAHSEVSQELSHALSRFDDVVCFFADGAGAEMAITEAIVADDPDWFGESLRRTILVATNFRMRLVGLCVPEFLDSSPPLVSVACFYGAQKCLSLCLSLGMDAAITDLRGRTAAHFACAGDGVDCIAVLNAAGLPLSNRDLGRRLPSDVAAELGNNRALKRLVKSGAEVDPRWAVGAASRNGHCDTVSYLIKKFGSGLVRDAVFSASAADQHAVLRMLLPLLEDGSLPLVVAAENSAEGCVNVLIEAQPHQFTPRLSKAVARGRNLAVLRMVMELGGSMKVLLDDLLEQGWITGALQVANALRLRLDPTKLVLPALFGRDIEYLSKGIDRRWLQSPDRAPLRDSRELGESETKLLATVGDADLELLCLTFARVKSGGLPQFSGTGRSDKHDRRRKESELTVSAERVIGAVSGDKPELLRPVLVEIRGENRALAVDFRGCPAALRGGALICQVCIFFGALKCIALVRGQEFRMPMKVTDEQGRPSGFYAVAGEHPELIEALRLDPVNPAQRALWTAAFASPAALSALPADVNWAGCLEAACLHMRPEMVVLCLTHGAFASGEAIKAAIRGGDLRCLMLLLASEKHCVPTEEHRLLAAGLRRAKMLIPLTTRSLERNVLTHLVESGGDVSEFLDESYRPLDYLLVPAARRGNIEALRVLLAGPCEPTPECAVAGASAGHRDCARVVFAALLERGLPSDHVVLLACKCGLAPELLRALPICPVPPDGALIGAVEGKSSACVEAILAKNVPVTSREVVAALNVDVGDRADPGRSRRRGA
jgi:ankyrin repeat protein